MSDDEEINVTDKGLKVLVINNVPVDSQGGSAVDLYLRMPTENHHIRWIRKGDEFTEEHRHRLRSHADPRLYCPMDQWTDYQHQNSLKEPNGPIGNDVKEIVSNLYADFLSSKTDNTEVLDKLIAIANTISDNVIADIAVYEAKAKEELLDISRLEMSYAIRSIATLFCIANDFASRKSIYDLTTATLYMDIGLNDFTNQELEAIWKGDKVDEKILKAYQQHPAKAHLIATERIKLVNETGLLIILNHHEYNNAKGFPRGVHTKALIDHVKIVSLAVDVWEILKVALLNEKPISFEEALKIASQPELEPHQRKHAGAVINKIFKHLGIK